MHNNFEHYHCSVCGKGYPTQGKAGDCFWNHSELEILRWMAFQLYSSLYFAELKRISLCTDCMGIAPELIKELNRKFQIAEIDENGSVWSLAIRGKRV